MIFLPWNYTKKNKKAPASDSKTGACNAYRLIFYFSFSAAGLAMDSLISVSALMFCIL